MFFDIIAIRVETPDITMNHILHTDTEIRCCEWERFLHSIHLLKESPLFSSKYISSCYLQSILSSVRFLYFLRIFWIFFLTNDIQDINFNILHLKLFAWFLTDQHWIFSFLDQAYYRMEYTANFTKNSFIFNTS